MTMLSTGNKAGKIAERTGKAADMWARIAETEALSILDRAQPLHERCAYVPLSETGREYIDGASVRWALADASDAFLEDGIQ